MQPQTEIDDTTLVAFLDGELTQEQSDAIEHNLESNERLRQRVHSLKVSWNLLGDLPEVEPRKDLARSTMEMVTLALEAESRSWRNWIFKSRWMTVPLSGLLMLAIGSACALALSRYLESRFLSNLPAIASYRALQHIDSIDFLRKLAQIENLTKAASNTAGLVQIGDGLVPKSIPERKVWVQNLKEVDWGRMESNLLDYRSLPTQRQEELQAISHEIYADADMTEEYLSAVRAYAAILDKLSTKRRGLLESITDIDERIQAIRERVNVLMAINYVPSPKDREAFRRWLDRLQEQNFDRLLYNENYDLDSLIIQQLLYGDPEESFVTPQDVKDLIDLLSPNAAKLLRDLENQSLQRFHLSSWISSVLQPASAGGQGLTADFNLEERFLAMPRDEQDDLEFLPEDEARNELRRRALEPQTGD